MLIRVSKDISLIVGKLGDLEFQKGSYAYIGSALNGLQGRLSRHQRKEKKIFWHIDYLLKKAIIEDIYFKETNKKEECLIADKLAKKFGSIRNFGSSDCKCSSHLFYIGELGLKIREIITMGFKKY
jgi:Uri superfamily endonuclease